MDGHSTVMKDSLLEAVSRGNGISERVVLNKYVVHKSQGEKMELNVSGHPNPP